MLGILPDYNGVIDRTEYWKSLAVLFVVYFVSLFIGGMVGASLEEYDSLIGVLSVWTIYMGLHLMCQIVKRGNSAGLPNWGSWLIALLSFCFPPLIIIVGLLKTDVLANF